MRNLNSDPTRRDVYLWSPARAAVVPGYHKIWERVKRIAPSPTSWGRGRIYGTLEETIGKLADHFGRSLPSNDVTPALGCGRSGIDSGERQLQPVLGTGSLCLNRV